MAGTEPQRAAVVFNPSKKVDLDLYALVAKICSDEGWDEPLWLETTVEDPGQGMTRQALDAGADLVIAAGGDGTVRCVSEVLAGTDTPLGLLPLGTGNLLARNLDIGINDPQSAVLDALKGTERHIDVVHINVDHAQDSHVFLVMAGIGFDAAIMGDTRDDLKDKVGWLAYVDAGIRNLPGKPARTRISIDGEKPFYRRVRSVMGGNCGKIMGGLEIFPGARLDDGLLEIMTVAPRGKLGWLGVIAGLLRRGKGNSPSLEYFQCEAAEIQAMMPQEIEIDGDPLGKGTHLSLRVQPRSLRIRMPYGKKDPAVLSQTEP
ncbi:diacylglycerol/lipid kinase family protein [Arthrobacter sp. GCM10027362]|uniref:diacylglycerol/lipid kinase family protein n=1 Tax=Arthrobacter sp. GCM10027362 TaxID=3273379 RepID=UPI00363F8369